MNIIQNPLPYFNERAEGKTPKYLVMHYTDQLSSADTLKILNEKKLSAHYLLDEDGTILQLVDEKNRAWHAGVSYWHEETDMNSSSIGIEIQNPGHSNGYRSFPKAQVKALIELSKDIMKRNNIPAKNVIAHSDIAPDRKKDPGELFPWKLLSENGVGVWVDATEDGIRKAAEIIDNEDRVLELFKNIGYAPVKTFNNATPDLKQIVTAFQRHFEPEVFKVGSEGTISIKTIALACKLLEEYND